MKKLLLLFFALWLTACSVPHPYKNLQLPNQNEYNQIIQAILQQDTILAGYGFLNHTPLATRLLKPAIIFVKPKLNTSNSSCTDLSPPTENPAIFNATLSELLYYCKTNSRNRYADSLYFAFQNDSSISVELDIKKISAFKFISENEINDSDSTRYHFTSYVRFSCPLLNSKKNQAYVLLTFVCDGLCGFGKMYVLQKVNGVWLLTFYKETWVS